MNAPFPQPRWTSRPRSRRDDLPHDTRGGTIGLTLRVLHSFMERDFLGAGGVFWGGVGRGGSSADRDGYTKITHDEHRHIGLGHLVLRGEAVAARRDGTRSYARRCETYFPAVAEVDDPPAGPTRPFEASRRSCCAFALRRSNASVVDVIGVPLESLDSAVGEVVAGVDSADGFVTSL